jgi:hypothetical protein
MEAKLRVHGLKKKKDNFGKSYRMRVFAPPGGGGELGVED